MARPYEPEHDRDALLRVWREIGWLVGDGPIAAAEAFIAAGRARVDDHDGAVEAFAISCPASLRYLGEELPASAVTGVGVGRVARRGGIARRLTAELVAADAAAGAAVALLGIFDQGYYDQLGFGCGPYEHTVWFDPLDLNVPRLERSPRRLSRDDAAEIHALRLGRRRVHGGLNLLPEAMTRGDLELEGDGFGLGFGEPLSHLVWFSQSKGETGPLEVGFLIYHDAAQLTELLAVMASLGDQIYTARLREPPDTMLQDYLIRPHRRAGTAGRKHPRRISARAYWQARICDLPRCIAALRLTGARRRFNLRLTDPIADYLPDEAPWRGCGGDYLVTLGPESQLEPGAVESLPTLSATLGAFTRLWLGVLPAGSLVAGGGLSGPPELIDGLDRALRLPRPQPDWDF